MPFETEAFNQARREENTRHFNQIQHLDRMERELNELFDNFMSYPLTPIPSSKFMEYISWYKIDIEKELTAIAKARGWLNARVLETRHDRWTLTLPVVKNRSRLVVAPLLLSAKPFNSAAQPFNQPLLVQARPKKWTFWFNGELGKQILDGWIEVCRTDTDMQVALMFGPMFNKEPTP